jgi:energy-coupling factor transporter ATP-binding protein EcfA2
MTKEQPMKTPEKALIRARGLRKEYGKDEGLVRAVDQIDLDIARGETVAVMGPSGCGKSTLLHLLGGLDRPSGGELPTVVAATFLVENLVLALFAALVGLVAGSLAAPLITKPGAALIGTAGAPVISLRTVVEVVGLAIVVSLRQHSFPPFAPRAAAPSPRSTTLPGRRNVAERSSGSRTGCQSRRCSVCAWSHAAPAVRCSARRTSASRSPAS